jgi:HSP20 family protein
MQKIAIHKEQEPAVAPARDSRPFFPALRPDMNPAAWFNTVAPLLWGSSRNIMEAMQRDMTRFFGLPFNDNLRFSAAWDPTQPRIDVLESESGFTVKAELPGLAPADIRVSAQASDRGAALVIAGEKREERREERGDYLCRECLDAAFSRTVPLPRDADLDAAKASFDQNVLKIDIPRKGMSSVAIDGGKKRKS